MTSKIDYAYLPEHMQDVAREYIENGFFPGTFLQAIICNKLKESFEEADKLTISRVFDFVCFFRNEAPVACWGSEKRMARWVRQEGLDGMRSSSTSDSGT